MLIEPFNYEVENMSPDLFRASIHQVRDFDRRFYNNTRNTTVMSVRDVIHITRSVIPYLNEFNVIGLTVGSNGANVPPATPKLHVWREPNTGLDIMVNLHPYGYGGYSKSICPGPGQCGDCAEAPNGVALCTEFRTDNTGPPESTDEVIGVLDAVRNEYPKASVFASTFDAFFEAIQPVKNLLPVITHEVSVADALDPRASWVLELSVLLASLLIQITFSIFFCDHSSSRLETLGFTACPRIH